jgi:hypothetical protein
MKIKTIHRIYDDNGKECSIGDTVLLQTSDMEEVIPATIENIMTNMATFIIDDRVLGYMPIKARVSDIVTLTLHQKKKKKEKDKDKDR